MRRNRKPNGFTMVELIIVILVIAILSVGGIYILSQSFRAAYTTRDLVHANWQSRLAFERMLRDIRATRFASSLVIGGTNDTLTFEDTEAITVKYELSGTNLIRREPDTAPTGAIVATGVSSLKFYPYDITGTQQASPNENTLFIQIKMTVTEGDTNLSMQTVVYPFNFAPEQV